MNAESPSESNDDFPKQLAHRFRGVLDRHGFGFQYAVLRKLHEIFNRRREWAFEVSEFPVITGRFDTRIDFIIHLKGMRLFLACECKRANPALNYWCFIRAPYVRRNRSHEYIFIDEVVSKYSPNDPNKPSSVSAHGKQLADTRYAYHIGFEVKNPKNKGDSQGGTGRKAIEDAAGQVCKGANGLLETFACLSKPTSLNDPAANEVASQVMPAIFTTAELWVTESNLAAADLSTGNLPTDAFGTMEQRPWIYLQYPISPAIKHRLPTDLFTSELHEVLDLDFTRTIAIINVDGIENFTGQLHDYVGGP